MTMTMKIKNILISIGLISVVLSSCSEDFLDPYPNGQRNEEDLWKYPTMVQGLIGQMYGYIPKNYDNNEGIYLECATDNAVSTDPSRNMAKWASNSLTTGQDPFREYWDRDYKGIYSANTFLKDNRGFNTRFLTATNGKADSVLRYRLQGEAFAFRAWFYWDLLQKFCGKASDGRMLGVPILTEPQSIEDGAVLSRNTFDECVQQILNDCDSAYKYLPLAHRDFLFNSAYLNYVGAKHWGRIDGITTRAIKADVYLTWASPRFNSGNDVARWDSAAVYAKKVIDFKLSIDGISNTQNTQRANAFNPTKSFDWGDPNAPEIVWASQFVYLTDVLEKALYPGGYSSNGTMGATQELVNSFGMANGYPIDHPSSGYDPANPYANRDPRFYATIFYNNAEARRKTNNELMYTFENWRSEEGLATGKDLAELKTNNSRTNYHIKKFVFMNWNPSDRSIQTVRRSKFIYRWEHMLLIFAEAANHVVASPSVAYNGLSPKDAIKYLRARPTSENKPGLFPTAADPYLDEASADTKAFDNLVKNERRITTCFEGNRFYDLRRWSTTLDELNMLASGEKDGYVHGADVIKKGDGTFVYNLSKKVEQRLFKSAYLPIPYLEILRTRNLEQNEGWDSWK